MISVKDILKPGASLEVRKIDIDDPEVIAQIEWVRKEQKRILDLKKIDFARLEKTYITI